MENQEKNQNQDVQKLTAAEFTWQLHDLLRKAPKDMVFFVHSMKDVATERDGTGQIFAMQGNIKALSFLLWEAFKTNEDFKDVVYTAVDIFKIKESTDKNSPHNLSLLGLFLASMHKKK